MWSNAANTSAATDPNSTPSASGADVNGLGEDLLDFDVITSSGDEEEITEDKRREYNNGNAKDNDDKSKDNPRRASGTEEVPLNQHSNSSDQEAANNSIDLKGHSTADDEGSDDDWVDVQPLVVNPVDGTTVPLNRSPSLSLKDEMNGNEVTTTLNEKEAAAIDCKGGVSHSTDDVVDHTKNDVDVQSYVEISEHESFLPSIAKKAKVEQQQAPTPQDMSVKPGTDTCIDAVVDKSSSSSLGKNDEKTMTEGVAKLCPARPNHLSQQDALVKNAAKAPSKDVVVEEKSSSFQGNNDEKTTNDTVTAKLSPSKQTGHALPALLKASKNGNAEEVRRIIEMGGCDVNASSGAGLTALHLASLWGHPKVVQILLEFGANPNLQNSSGQTAFHLIDGTDKLIQEEDRHTIVNLLLEAATDEFDISTMDCTGKLPLQDCLVAKSNPIPNYLGENYDEEQSRIHQMLLLTIHKGRKVRVDTEEYQNLQEIYTVLCGEDGFQLAMDLFNLFSETSTLSIGKQIVMIPLSNMLSHMEEFLNTRHEFHQHGKDVEVHIGYHYTNPENMDRIHSDGLLTRFDRELLGIFSHFHGDRMGDGVYTAMNCHASSCFGSIGIMVAQILGDCCNRYQPHYYKKEDSQQSKDYTVLRRSSQVLPLVAFEKDINRSFLLAYEDVVGALLNEMFSNKTEEKEE